MTVSNGDILKVVVSLDMPGDNIAQNVYYVQADFSADQTDTAVRLGVVDWIESIYDELANQIVAEVQLIDALVNKWVFDPVLGWVTSSFVGEGSLADTFANASDMLPHATAATATGYTSNVLTRSRKSFAGFGEDQQDTSTLSTTAIVAMVAAAVEWISSHAISSGNELRPGVPTKAGDFELFDSTLVSTIFGSQRQRKPGIGA